VGGLRAGGEELTQEAQQLLEYDQVRDNPARILQIPCAGTPEEESVEEGCGSG
jgi:hypothetical protein